MKKVTGLLLAIVGTLIATTAAAAPSARTVLIPVLGM